jgi:hypothetical protein
LSTRESTTMLEYLSRLRQLAMQGPRTEIFQRNGITPQHAQGSPSKSVIVGRWSKWCLYLDTEGQLIFRSSDGRVIKGVKGKVEAVIGPYALLADGRTYQIRYLTTSLQHLWHLPPLIEISPCRDYGLTVDGKVIPLRLELPTPHFDCPVYRLSICKDTDWQLRAYKCDGTFGSYSPYRFWYGE